MTLSSAYFFRYVPVKSSAIYPSNMHIYLPFSTTRPYGRGVLFMATRGLGIPGKNIYLPFINPTPFSLHAVIPVHLLASTKCWWHDFEAFDIFLSQTCPLPCISHTAVCAIVCWPASSISPTREDCGCACSTEGQLSRTNSCVHLYYQLHV